MNKARLYIIAMTSSVAANFLIIGCVIVIGNHNRVEDDDEQSLRGTAPSVEIRAPKKNQALADTLKID